jgi:adenylate cyclase class 2
MTYEVELKYRVADASSVRQELTRLGAVPQTDCTERDTYLSHPVRSFARTDEALRIREAEGGLRITYKGPKLDKTTKTRVEIELELAPAGNSAVELLQFWEHLGFHPVRTVDKQRQIWTLSWGGKEVSVCWDSVVGLGEFLELEILAESALLEESRQVLRSLASHLKLTDSVSRSYLELLLEQDETNLGNPQYQEDWRE